MLFLWNSFTVFSSTNVCLSRSVNNMPIYCNSHPLPTYNLFFSFEASEVFRLDGFTGNVPYFLISNIWGHDLVAWCVCVWTFVFKVRTVFLIELWCHQHSGTHQIVTAEFKNKWRKKKCHLAGVLCSGQSWLYAHFPASPTLIKMRFILAHTHTHSNIILSCLPPGLWLKSEDTVAMKTKRADFASAFLRGRMVVAGGLGEGGSVNVCVYVCVYVPVYVCFCWHLVGLDNVWWPGVIPRSPTLSSRHGGSLPPSEEEVGEIGSYGNATMLRLLHRHQGPPAGGWRS